MAEDPFVTSSNSQPPNIVRPIPRRNFSTYTDSSDSPTHAFAPTTPPSAHESQNRSADFLSQLNARLLRTYNARNGGLYDNGGAEGGGQPPPRNKSFLNMTKSTLFGIYDEDESTTADRSVAETPWGTGAETPARKSADAGKWANGLGSLDEGIVMKSRSRPNTKNGLGSRSPIPGQPSKPRRRRGLGKYIVVTGKLAALFVFGVVYGVVVSHLHDTRELAAVRVEGVDQESWTYFASWGLAGVALGCSLPYVELAWGGPGSDNGDSEDAEKEAEQSFGEQWNDIVRSVGAFMGIAFAIRRLPWQSTLQLTLTLALVNPALWYILDRSKPGLSFSLIVTSILTSFIFLSNPDVLPSPSLPATVNGTRTPTPAPIRADEELFAGVVSYENLAVVTWVGSVLFCSCVCFGSIGRRLAVWDEWGHKR
ncbi:hypothetical protein K458DRAFT_488104 [Lentithecium fluviatile CBS 122367]|uniref:INSIG domain-containing protein n=1 Tax=Lentithecium fluviatile CBS 122367 TaxID=1168545 RepID=A0A6G1IYZ0_9PLEO|nr:hypothetical protein K458DRAFT_488104 [Lentithecium fluviatile CBS 122367]